MKKIITFVLLVLFCIGGQAQIIDPVLLQEMEQRSDDEKIPVVVIMKSQYNMQQLDRSAANYSIRAERRTFVVNELKRFAEASQYDLRTSLNEMERHGMTTTPTTLWMANAMYFSATKQAINDLSMRSDIEIIGWDETRRALIDEGSTLLRSTQSIASNVTKVNADQVWDLGYTGQGVVVAILDSGVNYNHLDLADHLWDGGSDYPHHGYDFINGDNDPMDDNGHGTHCAGTICGDGTAGTQTGIAPDATLMCVKVLNGSNNGSVTLTCNAVQWAVEQGCDVLNIPFGWTNSSISERTLLRNTCVSVLNAGVIAAVAAGDNGYYYSSNYPIPDNVTAPGSCPPPYMDPIQANNAGGLSCVISVGSVDNYDYLNSHSSRGPVTWSNTNYTDYPYTEGSSTEFGLIRPDLCAPGYNIVSTTHNNTSGYVAKSGTSMASACMAGCISLLLSKNVNATPAQICQVLEENAHSLSAGKTNTFGYGRVDVMAAINAMTAGPLSLEAVAVNDILGNNDGKLNVGESVSLHLTLRNDSETALNGVSLVLSSESDDVTITTGTATLPSFAPNQTRTLENIFSFTLSDDATEVQSVRFAAEATLNGELLGIIRFDIVVYGQNLVFEQVTVTNDNNGNGSLEAGESATLHVVISNAGNSSAPNITGVLSSTFPHLTVNSTSQSFGTIAAGEQASADFNVSLASTSPDGYTIDLSLDLLDGNGEHTEMEFEIWRKAISLTSNPVGAGILTGGGNYGEGQSCTITATPNSNYVFSKWTLNGATVSNYPSYTFSVTDGAEYVAHFKQIDGIAIGIPTTTSYFFPCYGYDNYNLTQQLYTASEMGGQACNISSVSFYHTYNSTTTRDITIYMVHTNKTVFANTRDWISVTDANKVFSGNVTMSRDSWTTIYFETPFSFNGTSNVALIVDDNTGSSSHSSYHCRAFTTTGDQALHIASDNTNYNPYSPYYYNYNGWLSTVKNQVVFGYARYDYTVAASANPSEGGTVSEVEDSYYYGQPVTLTATPNPGYVFCNWTKNGEVVCNYPAYSFSVTESVQLVANFQQLEGVAIGNPTASSNYLPIYYRHSLTQQIYTATEMGGEARQINSVSFYNTYNYNVSKENLKVYLLETDKSSFANNTDWITVTEADEVFSGSVSFTGGWTTVYFNRVFDYDGTSNLALIFVDNYPGSGGMYCRTFTTDSNQAIRIYNANTNFDPINLTGNIGTLVSEKNEVVFGSPTGSYTVTVTANPTAGGTVSGGGDSYYSGQSCTVTATANEGYCFYNWTIDGTVVSSDATYTFPVSGNMNIVANFGDPIMITASVNPEQCGTVNGAGGYAPGHTCTLTAIPSEGYGFRYWLRNGNVVSSLPTYSFTVSTYNAGEYVAYFQQETGFVIGEPTATSGYLPSNMDAYYSLTQQIYTSDELGEARQISSVSFFNATSYYPTRDIVIYMVQTNKTAFDNENDWISVTEANQVYSGSFKPTYRNWSTIYFNTPFNYDGSSNIALVVYDKTCSRSSSMAFRTFDAEGTQAIRFSSQNFIDPLAPTYTGTLMPVKNQIMLGTAIYEYTVTVTANPAAGGTVSGGEGLHYYGHPVTITATPNPGYAFKCWTKNNNQVSYLSPATLAVTSNTEYVAQFVPLEGIAIGEPNHTNIHLPSYNYSYYSLSQQIYTAEELNTGLCQISSVSFFKTGYNITRDFTIYMVNTTKSEFNDLNDWISVTDENIVFSGIVNITGAAWTTIYFNTPFNYDGTSNVALVVYDHTGYNDFEQDWRTFSTPTNQAICAADSYYPINPSNPIAVSTLLSEKNHVVFGVASYDYTMTLASDPDEGGTVSVDNPGFNGYYYYGQPVTISAVPNQGYVFNEWTKSYVGSNGNTQNTTVSYLSTSDIALTETADYVAHFQQMDGIIIGEAAKTNERFPFNNYHSLTQQIYTAEELGTNPCQISSVSFFNTGSSMTRELDVYMVNTTKNEFDSSTDWIPVTEADLVYSGSVSVSSYGWTTIFFSMPFNYTGSNVALIINTKSSLYYGYNYRTFDTDDTYQAICSSRSGTGNNYDPTNPSQYSGNRYTEKNQIVFGVVSYDYPITVSANPTEGGTASIIGNGVNGYYYYGQPIALSATTNSGYAFSKWTKDDEIVSCLPEHTLSVTDSAEYVANFRQVDGILIGEPSYVNSNLPTPTVYSYNSMTQEIYTAAEMGGQPLKISSVSFFSAGGAKTRNNISIYMVHTEKTVFDSITDWIPIPGNTQALFSGRVSFPAKNWVTIYFANPFEYNGTSNVALIVCDNSKSYIGYNSDIKCRTFDTEDNQGNLVNQVLRINSSSSNTTFDPLNPTGNGTLMSVKNQVIFDRANYNCNIFASANPWNGGWVTGDIGPHYYGQPVTLNAMPSSDYVFTNWTKDGEVVSDYPTYSFTATETASFIANFKKVDGVAIGEPVSNNANLPQASYYSLTQQIYTVAELGTTPREISSVSFYNAGTSSGAHTNANIYMVYTDKTSFNSTNDWIAVDSTDMVFSGSFSILANDWTTINFNKVFNYNGSSNVVLIVDNNYGSYNYTGLNGRIFNTTGNQAIRIYGYNGDYDPFNPTDYSGTLLTQKNQVIFGPPSRIYTVTPTANPAEGGTVSGGGEGYFLGELCTVTATANEGYVFYNWTLDGNVVSSDETYTFPVTGNMNLVANFGTPINITVTVDPVEGGQVSGGGGYALNHSCTLTATANPGYVFKKWTYRKNNSTYSSYLSTYTFSVTEAIEYTAHFEPVNNGIAIGTADISNSYLPICSYYSMSQQIYTAAEMGNVPHEISSVSFFNLYGYETRNLTVYMVHTEKTEFANGTDWIPVTEDDIVFSGTISRSSYNWWTIYFSTPFSYNGLDNIALIIDNNSNNYASTNYRTFTTEGNQAIRVSGSGTNYDPYNPNGYTGTLMSEKNQVIFGFVASIYPVSLTASPAEGGTVSGGEGLYYLGEPCTVTATPNEGYIFYYWKKNNTIVSKDATYTFQVMDTTNLVAHFGPPIHITVSVNIEGSGTVTGAGEYAHQQACTLTATPNPGYVFNRWEQVMSNYNYQLDYVDTYNFTVTTDASYVAIFERAYPNIVVGGSEFFNYDLPYCSNYINEYSISEQIYTAEEIGTAGEIQSLSFFCSSGYYEFDPELTIYLKHTNKSDFSDHYDWISVTEADRVFNGTIENIYYGEWYKITLDTPFQYDGTSNLVIVVYNHTGAYVNISTRAFTTESYQSLYTNGYSDLSISNMSDNWGMMPNCKNQIGFGISKTQTVTLAAGWNWFSAYVESDTLLQQLETKLGEYGIQIKSKTKVTAWDEDEEEWDGPLQNEGLSNDMTYMIQTTAACTLTLEGAVSVPRNHAITLNPGWNWIGFPSAVALSVADALSGFEAMDGDQLKSKTQGTAWDDDAEEWSGTLTTLTPGQGYMFYSNSNEPRTLVFQTTRKSNKSKEPPMGN